MERDSLETALAAAERLSHAGKLDEAIARLEPHVMPPFLNWNEQLNNATFLLSGLYLTTERFREGEKLVEAALPVASPDQKLDMHRRRSHFYTARGHVHKAKQELATVEALEASLDDPLVRSYARVLRLSLGGEPEITYQATLEALEILPQDRTGSSALASVAAYLSFDVGRYADALRWASKTLAHPHATPSELTEALRLKAQISAVQGNTNEALDHLQKATYLARRGADWQTATELALVSARTLYLQGALTAAEVLAQETAKHFAPTQANALSLQVFCACSRGDLIVAEEALEQAGAATRKSHVLAAAHGTLAWEKGDYDQALHYLNQQRRGAQGVAEQLLRLAQVSLLWRTGQHARADEEMTMLMTLPKESWSREQRTAFYRMEARLAYLKKDWSAGITAWKQVLRLEPYPLKQAENWAQLGDGYIAQGETEAARFAWERAAAQPVESIWVRRAKERLEAS